MEQRGWIAGVLVLVIMPLMRRRFSVHMLVAFARVMVHIRSVWGVRMTGRRVMLLGDA